MSERADPRASDGGVATAVEAPVATAILFDAKGDDREIPLSDVGTRSIRPHELLWVDVFALADEDVVSLLDRLGVPADAQPYLLRPCGRPAADDHGGVLHVEVAALSDPDDEEPVSIVCIVGSGWVVTTHAGPVPFLDDFRERASGGSQLGDLDAPSFLARLLEWQLTTYNAAIEDIAESIDDLDQDLLVSLQHHTDLLPQLVALRKRIAALRMQLRPTARSSRDSRAPNWTTSRARNRPRRSARSHVGSPT